MECRFLIPLINLCGGKVQHLEWDKIVNQKVLKIISYEIL